MRETRHFGGGGFQAGVGALKGAGAGAKDRSAGGGLRGGVPVIKPRTHAGGAGGKVVVKAHGKHPQPQHEHQGHGGEFQFLRPVATE